MKFIDDTRIPDHPYAELRHVLITFVAEVSAILRENLVGIYLVGSIASGDFDLDSDVDFLVVTNTDLTEADMKPLQDIQSKIHDIDCYPAKHLEGSYISIGDLNNWSIVGTKKLYYFDNGSTTYEQSTHDNQWHVRWILRERGITLLGPKPKTIVRSIPRNELSNEIKTTMLQVKRLFEDEINRPLSFFNSRFGQSFTVLTYCRMLHTLHTGTVQSKQAGMQWAKQFVDPKWAKLIEQAWHEREGVRFGVKIGQRAESTLLYETLEFINYAVTQIDKVEVPASLESPTPGGSEPDINEGDRMKQLSREAFERARQFLMTQSRPLERALFRQRFEGAAVEGVLGELARFQNEDGGFGRALEPDLRTPSSSPLATGIGLQLLRELKSPADHPMVRKAVAYLIATYEAEIPGWRPVSPDANSFPHAPWWHDEQGSLARLFDGFRIIPRALIVGSLHHFSTLVPPGWLEQVTAETVRYIEMVELLGEGGGSDLQYAISLAEAQNLPSHYAKRLEARIRAAIPTVVERDSTQWDFYCITPLRIVPAPQSLGADLIQDELKRHLDFQISRQTPEGTWDPAWSWEGTYPDVWPTAEREWRGHLTLEILTQLNAFARIEA